MAFGRKLEGIVMGSFIPLAGKTSTHQSRLPYPTTKHL